MFWHKVMAELLRQENVRNVRAVSEQGGMGKCRKCRSNGGARWDGKMSEMSEQSRSRWTGKTSEQSWSKVGKKMVYDNWADSGMEIYQNSVLLELHDADS